MPYTVRKNPSGGYDILKHGKKVAHATTKKNAGIYMWKAGQGDRKKK